MTHRPLKWFELHWPREVTAEHVVTSLRSLAASSATPVILEAVGSLGTVVHRLAVPEAAAPMLLQQLRGAFPGVALIALPDRPSLEVDQAVEVCLSTTIRPLAVDATEAACRALLTALSGVEAGESLTLQWQLIGVAPSRAVGSSERTHSSGSWLTDASRALLGGSPPLDAEARGAMRSKRSVPGWRVVGRIGTHAKYPARRRQLIQHVAAALRSAEAPGAHFVLRSTTPRKLVELKRPWRVPMLLNVEELATISSWPVGDTRSYPVNRQTSRAVAPASSVPSTGRRLGVATYSGRERAIALGVRDSLRHLHVIGPTGVGKSTLLLNLISQDMEAGRAVVVVEPKGDLIADVLARVPDHRLDDVVLIDPKDRTGVVGVNPLQANGHSSELVADQLLGVFHHLYAASWGPRTSDILHAALLSLARTEGMSLAALPLLLADPGFRRRIVGSLDEPLVLQPFWQAFEAWSEAERTAAVAPVLNKVRPLLVRPSLRAVLGQVSPRFRLRQVFTERKILLLNLSKGLMGPEAAALLGSVIVAQLWQTALERSAIPAEKRHPVFVFLDEFQDYLNLPTDLGDALAQARGLGIGLALSHQHLGQLSPQMRSAVLANARSRIAFQLAAEDAKAFGSSDAVLVAEDFRSLAAFEAYAQLVASDAVQPWLSLRTSASPPLLSDPDSVRARSRHAYGVAPAHVDQQLQALRGSTRVGDLGSRRRAGGEQ